MWGSDASTFDPTRWTDRKLPDGALDMPGISFPTFLAGPRSCIGYRFTLIEYAFIRFLSTSRESLMFVLIPQDESGVVFINSSIKV